MELFHSAALLFQIPRCRVVDQPALLCKTGAVAGAIPGVLLGIPLQRAAQVGAASCSGRQQADHGFPAIDSLLGAEDRAGRRKYFCKRMLLSLNEIA